MYVCIYVRTSVCVWCVYAVTRRLTTTTKFGLLSFAFFAIVSEKNRNKREPPLLLSHDGMHARSARHVWVRCTTGSYENSLGL